ncbi:MAG: hypothetical protein HY270_10320 [Deltaproteobacteria bacterium]|nr:hypothetical protein [Deltaproteobacteria bacterium]
MALIFDIETIADLSPANRGAVEALAAGREMSPDHYGALCPPLARVVCIAWFDSASNQLGAAFDARLLGTPAPASVEIVTADDAALGCRLDACGDEAQLLESFAARLETHVSGSEPQVVTFNVRGFDLPVLVHRSLRCGVSRGRSLLLKLLAENRYRPMLHIDLMDTLTFFGATSRWPLAAYAIGYGLPSPKGEMDGSQVGAAVAGGKIVDVARYCAGDVWATAEVYRKVREVDGWLPGKT